MRRFFLPALALLGGAWGAFGQTPAPSPASTPASARDFWQAEMPAGNYIVRLSVITSVSMHEYIVDGAARVTEVTIGTFGTELARFYFIEPNVPQAPGGVGQSAINLVQEKLQTVTERVNAEDVWKAVAKNYPTTTHARTIEYRLATKESLKKLFESLQTSWLTGRGSVFKP